jgi:hypothetical protein
MLLSTVTLSVSTLSYFRGCGVSPPPPTLAGADCRVNQTRFRRAGGVQLLVPWLRHPVDDSVSVSKVNIPVAALALTWEAVARNKKNETKFVGEVCVVYLRCERRVSPPSALLRAAQALACLHARVCSVCCLVVAVAHVPNACCVCVPSCSRMPSLCPSAALFLCPALPCCCASGTALC